MHAMKLLFRGDVFSGYEYEANISVTGNLSARRNRELLIDGITGSFARTFVSPVADIDLMLELAARQFFVEHLLARNVPMESVEVSCEIDDEGHSQELTLLSALLAWLNHYDIDDDSVRESVTDLSLFEQKILLVYCERRNLNQEKLVKLIKSFFAHSQDALYKYARLLTGKTSL